MSRPYSEPVYELAAEIIQILGGDQDQDEAFVAEWLVEGGDDGVSAAELADSLNSQHALPSKG